MKPLLLLKRTTAVLGNALVWFLRIGTAYLSVFLGLSELSGNLAAVEEFRVLGLHPWLLYVSGGLQLIAGIALLFPDLSALGALLLIVVWAVIMVADLMATGYASAESVILILALIILWAGRDRLPTVLGGKPRGEQASHRTVWWLPSPRYLLPVGLSIAIVGGLLYFLQRAEWGAADKEGAAAAWRDDFPGAVASYRKAIQEAKQLPFSQREVVTSLNNLGATYLRANQLPEAEAAFRQALQLSRESLDPHDPLYYGSVHGLASVFARHLRFAEAEALYLQAIAAYASLSAPPAEGFVARGFKKAARFARWIGEPVIAADLDGGAKVWIDHALNQQVNGLPAVMDGLASLYGGQDEFRKAEEHYKRSLILKGQILGGGSKDLGQRLLATGLMTDDQGNPLEGPALYHKVDPIIEHIGVENRDSLSESLNNLALMYWEEGRYIEAEPLYYLSLALKNPQNKSGYAMTLTNLGLLYNSQRRYAEAEPKLLDGLAIRERILSPNHPDLGHSYSNLGLLYDYQNQYAKAESFYRKAIAIREQSLGPTHPKTVLNLGLLARLYFRQSQFSQAEPLYHRLLHIREQELGSGHQTVLNLMWTLAGIYSEQGKYQDALSLYERLIAHLEEQLGSDNPRLIQLLTSYAHVLERAKKTKEAARVRNRIKELSPEALPLPRPSPRKNTT